MKKLFCLLTLSVCFSLAAQTDKQREDDNSLFFYNAVLTDGKDVKIGGLDLDFHINTYKILENAGVIDSMFVRDNEKQLEQIDNRNWSFIADFRITKQQKKSPQIFLNIEQLDGNCTILINKKKVQYCNNSFIDYCIDVKKYIKKGNNRIELRFQPKDSVRMNQRSPQYLYGWDWHPKTLAPRIGAIYLSFEDSSPVIDYANIQTKSFISNEDKTVNASMVLNVHFREPLKQPSQLSFLNKKATLIPNQSGYYSVDFTFDSAQLWWPNNLGVQRMYEALLYLDTIPYPLKKVPFGVRTVSLVREKDSVGESFFFRVNNQDVFMKGANYIMTYDNCLTDVVYAAAADINMFRIWGGSDYGSEEFYNLCDKYGIMVWQDYPFSTELYPVNAEFINNVTKDAVQNTMRIAAHPSLALMCGNNEIWEGWQHWGWKQTVKDTIKAVKDYDYLFKGVLDSISHAYVPTVDYIHSSPVNHGWGNPKSLTNGDCHYYGVWWADSNFETYTHKIPRFMSEYGFQGAMNPETAEKFCSHPYVKSNPSFAVHQKHDRGFELVDNRIKEWFGDYAGDDEKYIFYSQLTQQEGMKLAMEHHRLHKPYCMGSLFWQYNEPYPCVGWGCLDYGGEPKPLYYTVQKAFDPLVFIVDKNDADSVKVYVCSDLLEDTFLTYKLEILNDRDSVHYIDVQEHVKIPANSVRLLQKVAYKDLKDFNAKKDYLLIEGFYGDEFISNYAFFCYPKDYVSFEKYLETIYEYYFEDEEK